MMMWTLRDLKRANGVPSAGANFDVDGVSIDSRTVQKQDVFVALKGERDGHDFVQKAFENGAKVAVVEHVVDCEIEQIVVPDTLKALWNMGEYQRKHAQATRVAVTGSCGKTTTKEMLGAVLKAHKSEGSYNNHLGVPLTLSRMDREAEMAVFEIGMNHPGEIMPLSQLVKPDIAVVTNIAPVHIGAFADENEIAIEKLSIQKGLVPEGRLVTSIQVYEKYKHYFDVEPVLFSMNEYDDVPVKLEKVTQSATGQNIVANVAGSLVSYRLHLFGDHAIYNSLAALTVAMELGVDMKQAALALELIQPVAGRGNAYEVDGVEVIDESYNANPASVRAAVQTLLNRPGKGRCVAVLGDMKELGENSAQYHRDLADICEELDTLITIGSDMRHLHEALKNKEGLTTWHVDEQKEMNLDKFARQLEIGDVVMVKGSKTSLWNYNFVERLVKAIENRKGK